MKDSDNKDAPLELREDGQLWHAGQKVVGYVDDDGAYHSLGVMNIKADSGTRTGETRVKLSYSTHLIGPGSGD